MLGLPPSLTKLQCRFLVVRPRGCTPSGSALGNGCPTRRGAVSIHSSVAVRKKLQNLGKSKVLLLDQDLLGVLLPDGDLEQTLLVEIAGDALVVRRETSAPLPRAAVEAAVSPGPLRALNVTEQRVLAAVAQAPGTTNEITERIGNRSRPTVSLALNRLQRAGLVSKTGRDWSVTNVGRAAVRG